MRLRTGKPCERNELEALQLRSSIALPAYRDAILQSPDSIELRLELLREGRVRVAEVVGSLVGFSVTLPVVANVAVLDALFVEPARWRRGIGTALLRDAIESARAEGATAMEVTSNPSALDFYTRFRFIRLNETLTRFGLAQRMSCSLALPAGSPQI